MYKTIFNKRSSFKFKHFTNKGYALFACLGKEVLVGTLSVATLTYAKAEGVSVEVNTANTDSVVNKREMMLDEVNVTGSRAPLTRSQQARMVTVLNREDIQAAAVHSVNDLLKYAVGVDVRQRGPIGAQTDISVRGGNYEQITVLLNGINICDPQTGHNTFDFPVELSEIERIEVLEGPSGRVYGTSSLLGAINIVTKTPMQSSVTARVEGGSFGYLAAGARINYAQGKWNNQLSGSYGRSDGYTRNAKGALSSDFSSAKAFYQGNYDDEHVNVKWHAGITSKDFGANTFYGVKYDDQYEHTFKSYTALQAETKKGVIHFRPAVYWNHGYDRFELFRNHPDYYPFNYHRTDVFGVNINAYFDWWLGRTAFGGELRNEDIVSTNLGEPLNRPRHIDGTDLMYRKGLNRTNIQWALEHNILLERFTLSAGLVAVKNTWAEMNMTVYPGIDVSYRLGNNWKIYASYNTSLRMPSFTELYYSKGGHLADKHLKPEELQALECGVKYTGNGISGTAALYHNHHVDLIDWISDGTLDENGSLLWKSVNFGEINSLVFETSLRFDLLTLLPAQHVLKNIQLGYSYITQEQTAAAGITSLYTLEYLKNKFVASAQLNIWRHLDLSMSYRLQHRTGEYYNRKAERCRYGTCNILDAKLAWNDNRWTVYVAGNNLTDTHYMDVGNVAQPGAWIMAGATININL